MASVIYPKKFHTDDVNLFRIQTGALIINLIILHNYALNHAVTFSNRTVCFNLHGFSMGLSDISITLYFFLSSEHVREKVVKETDSDHGKNCTIIDYFELLRTVFSRNLITFDR